MRPSVPDVDLVRQTGGPGEARLAETKSFDPTLRTPTFKWIWTGLLAFGLLACGFLIGRISRPIEIAEQRTTTPTANRSASEPPKGLTPLATPLPSGTPTAETPTSIVTPEPRPTRTRRGRRTPTPTRKPRRTRTPTEAPSPTPEIWPDYRTEPARSKAGLHVIRNEDYRIMEFVRRMKPIVMKAVDDLGWLEELKQVSPDTITVGRFSNQDLEVVNRVDPEAYAREFVERWLHEYRLHPWVDYWEGWNEFDPPDAASWDWYTRFEAERACAMAEKGLRAAIGTFSTGVPEYDEMGRFVPALRAASRCGAILSVHEYAAPTMTCGVGIGIPGAPSFPGVTVGTTTLRYRYWYEGYLKPLGLTDVKVVISEAGIDGGAQQCEGGGGAGWKDFRNYWERSGLTTDAIDYYLEQISWYDSEVRKDPYVIGFTLFAAGAVGESGGFTSFDLHDMIIPLAFYVAGQ